MNESLYSRRSNLVVGFHGCDQAVVDEVVAGKKANVHPVAQKDKDC
nr:hypothetical protein [uncultured Prevotella sp.]